MKTHLLQIKKLSIEFLSQDEFATAQLTIGKEWRHRLIKVYFNETGEKCVQTDCQGNFQIIIGPNVDKLTVTVKPKGECLAVSRTFNYYEMNELVWRSMSGIGNNMVQPEWGSAGQNLLRKNGPRALKTRSQVLDGVNPRLISNAVCRQTGSRPNSRGLKNLVWGFGQFLDHELDLTPDDSGESANMTCPLDDPLEEYPGRTIPFTRSGYRLDENGDRQFPNQISCFIDATNVYGYSQERAYALRTVDGTGRLKTTAGPDGDLLPDNSAGLPNANPTGLPPSEQFLAGDIRANENILLISFHTLFVREHNRVCRLIVEERPYWAGQDELIYQHARSIVVGLMQWIVYNEFLPAILGPYAPVIEGNYDTSIDPGIAIEFSTAGYRLGHTMLTSFLKTVDADGTEGEVSLRSSFFRPNYIRDHGIDALLRGASQQIMEEVDGKVVDDVRNFLFGAPTAEKLLDLTSLNIQRGRDHGIGSYNEVRVAYGLNAKNSFDEVSSDILVVESLQSVYSSVNDIDPWIGALVEDHLPGSAVGELVTAILVDQFSRLCACDCFWFERDPGLTDIELEQIRSTSLADIIARNTQISRESLNDKVFL